MAIYENGTKKVVEGRDTMTEEYASILELGDIVGLDFLVKLVEGFMFRTES